MNRYSFKVKERLQGVARSFGFEFRRVQDESQRWLWLREWNIRTVLDVGANVGLFTECMWQVFPEARIYAFEPIPECYHTLIRKYSLHRGFEAFNVALGSKHERAVMMKNEFLPSSSLLPMEERHRLSFPYASRVKPVEVQVVPLDVMLPMLRLDTEVLLKIDVQGFENEVLDGGRNVLSQTKVAIVETSFVELYRSQPLFGEIFHLMSQNGFEFIGCGEPTRDPLTGRVLQADAYFLRKR